MQPLVLLLFLALTLGQFWLEALNLSHLKRHGSLVPEGFEGAVRGEALARACAYTLERSRLGIAESLALKVITALFLFAGGLPAYDGWVQSLGLPFVGAGLFFSLPLILALSLFHLPFSLVHTFGIEGRFGFNRTTAALWCTDQIKALLLSLVLSALLVGAALGLVSWSPERWWVWVWAFAGLASLFLMYVSPWLIEPLFFRFEPVGRQDLEQGIRELMSRAGLEAGKVLKVDASKRSGHSNAYFTGIGRVKRIVLFDTLLEQMQTEQILAVLAHEVGHWKLGHIRRRILTAQLQCLAGCFFAFALTHQPCLAGVVGAGELSFCGRALVLLFLLGLLGFLLGPLQAALSRRDERQADDFAVRLTGNPEALASALVRLGTENLSNLHPHPWYAWYHYSHPPLVQRVRRLRSLKVS